MTRRARPADVLYVTYDGLLEPLGASQVVPYVLGAARAGVGVEVLSFEKPADLADEVRASALAATLEAEGVRWTPLRYHRTPSLPATAWDVLQGSRRVAAWARARRGSGRGSGIIHARGYLPGLMGRNGRKRASDTKLLFDMRGFWVDERIEGGYWRPGSLPVRLGRWTERTLLREADHLVLLTRRAARRLGELAGTHVLAPWTVIPTCVDLDRFRPPSDPVAARLKVGLPSDGPVLIHTGTLTGWYDPAATLEVARRFLEQSGGTFVILTRQTEEARRRASAAGIDAVVASAPPEEVPAWLQAADAGLALVRPTPAKDASFATKVGEYLAAGLAVLGTPVGDMETLDAPDVVALHRSGDDPAASAAWLGRAAASPERVHRARALAEARLGLDQGVADLLGVYAALGVRVEGR